jgi:hypothetical protein
VECNKKVVLQMIITRRNVLRGMFATPAIIAIDRLMPLSFMQPSYLDPMLLKILGVQPMGNAVGQLALIVARSNVGKSRFSSMVEPSVVDRGTEVRFLKAGPT